MKPRGAAMVREVIASESRDMQTRAYKRLRPYLSGALSRLRRAYPTFQTVVFNAERTDFALVFGDGMRTSEAPKAFDGLRMACVALARFSEIEWLTAADALWQCRQGTPQPAVVIEQYRHIESADWQFWMRRPLCDARYYMRQEVYFRTAHSSHRPGYGKRIVTENGVVVDEWVDPVEALIVRVLREKGAPISLDPLCAALSAIVGCSAHGFYIWDVLRACEHLVQKGTLRRINPRSSENDARFVLCAQAKEQG